MKIFVSHALSDQDLLKGLKGTLEPHGIKLLIAEHYIKLDSTVNDKIEKMINSCNVALILLTENGFNSNFVQQEIGYIQKCKKPILQVIQLGIEKKITGFTFGRDYIPYDPTLPALTLTKVKRRLISHWQQLEKNRIAIHNATLNRKRELEFFRLENERKANEATIGFGILAGLLILGMSK